MPGSVFLSEGCDFEVILNRIALLKDTFPNRPISREKLWDFPFSSSLTGSLANILDLDNFRQIMPDTPLEKVTN